MVVCLKLSQGGMGQANDIKVSSQSRKSEFRVFSIVHLNIYNF